MISAGSLHISAMLTDLWFYGNIIPILYSIFVRNKASVTIEFQYKHSFVSNKVENKYPILLTGCLNDLIKLYWI